MRTQDDRLPIAWLEAGDAFPEVTQACGPRTPTPGLLAAGRQLDTPTLLRAYRAGIFPWFSDDQPVLWWSPDPRMVLVPGEFRVHRSFRKLLRKFTSDPACEVRVDSAFEQVILGCASSPRAGQNGTWIVPKMRRAYTDLNRSGFAHSVETWIDGELAGGLYCVALGQAVFGESMFTRVSGASRVALAALVAMCRQHGIGMLDCQQHTAHLRLLGAREIARSDFCRHMLSAEACAAPVWKFDPVYWKHLLP
jgi:leucyl/phenylalanyl-tRNA--protein transferase